MRKQNSTRHYRLAINACLWAFLVIDMLGCGVAKSGVTPSNARAIQVWKAHEVAVERAIDGNQRDDEFPEACAFFEKVAGLEIDANIFTLGFAPTPETEGDLKKARAWFRENKDRLYWDETAEEVRVKTKATEASEK